MDNDSRDYTWVPCDWNGTTGFTPTAYGPTMTGEIGEIKRYRTMDDLENCQNGNDYPRPHPQ
jgi:hypothetical protein